MVMWYNKTLYDKKKEATDPENVQDLALGGQWTYDELYRWATRIYEDSNGEDGRQGNDTYGFGVGKRGAGNPAPGDAIPLGTLISLPKRTTVLTSTILSVTQRLQKL